MKLLITKTAYQGNTTLPGITANQQNMVMNNIDCVYCDITDTAAWGQVRQSLDVKSYSDGVLLPEEVVEG